MREFGFELALCAHLERGDRIVARQLGAHVHGRRIADTVLVDPGPDFEARASITSETIPDPLIAADAGPGRARDWTDALAVHPDRAQGLIDRGVDLGFLEETGPGEHRQTTRYPAEWFDRLVGIENKPDLDRPGDLQAQLRTDVSLGLFDEVVLATADYVTGAHRNRIPDAVGIWRFDPETGERTVLREAEPLAVAEAGVEPIERAPGRTDVAIAGPEEKRRARRRLAERAYGKGWRTFGWPDCAACDPSTDDREASVPYCQWAGRVVDPASECGESCPGYDPADPPAVDAEGERAARSAWDPDPAGHQRRQTGLDRFG